MTPPAATERSGEESPPARLSRLKDIAEIVSFLCFCWTIIFGIAVIADRHWRDFIGYAAALVFASALTSVSVPRRLREEKARLRHRRRVQRLVRLEIVLAGCALVTSFILLDKDADESRVLGPVLFGAAVSASVVHFAVRMCAKSYGAQRRSVPLQVTVIAGAMIFVASTAFVAGAAWALGARAWGIPTPTQVAMLDDATNRPSGRESRRDDDSKNSEGTDRGERILVTPAPPEEADVGGVVDDGACRLKTRVALLEAAPMKVAGRAMWREWLHKGPDVAGCVEHLEERSGRLVATLRGGKSDPTLLVSDRLGSAAIVFEELVWVVDQLLREETLDYVGARVGTGFGNYQTFFLRDGRCMMAGRVFPHPYVVLPPAATVLIDNEGADRRKFPSVAGESLTTRRQKIFVTFQGADGSDERETVIVSGNQTAWLKGHPERAVSPVAPCSDPRRLQSLADALFQRYLRENPELLN